MRRLLLTLTLAVAGVALASPAKAQMPLKFGVQAGYLTGLDEVTAAAAALGVPDFNGTFGLGPRVALQPPVLPIGLVGQAVYYFPEGDASLLTYSLAAQLRLPIPVISPYVIGGWQFRKGDDETQSGAMLGAGVQLNLGLSLFLEGTMEFNEAPSTTIDADNSIVIKGGVMLG